MIRNTSDRGTRPPRLRCYLNLMTLEDLPQDSAAPATREVEPLFEALLRAGYEGVQFTAPVTSAQQAVCSRLGLGKAGSGRVNRPEDAETLAARFRDEGLECATLHAGWGMEDDDEAGRLIDAVLNASERHAVPLYVETHRATIFQDLWRTVQFVRRFPELRFNGDFSHWYTGLEMVYGGFEKKLAFISPVLERVRFVHGRIGNPGSIQVDVGVGDASAHPYVDHFRELWTASFRGFLSSAQEGDYLLFVPELLSPRIYYALAAEKSDRWEQSLVLRRIAEQCFARARETHHER
jgi:sugar phosphate isomerase/epimerase